MSDATNDRRAEFEAQLAEVRVKSGTAESEQRMMVVGLVLAIAGIVVAFAAFFASGSMSDQRDVTSAVTLAVAGLGLSVVGSAVYLRYSFGRFLRFWMLRMLYEQQAEDTAR